MPDIDLTKSLQDKKVTPAHESVPRPAKPVPGVKGQPPLPIGRTVAVPKSMTTGEKQALESIGWQEGQPIPANLVEQVAAAEREARQDADIDRLPVDPSTPPLEVNTVNIDSLPADKQAQIKKIIDDMAEEEAAAASLTVDMSRASPVAQKVAKAKQVPFDATEKPERPAQRHTLDPDEGLQAEQPVPANAAAEDSPTLEMVPTAEPATLGGAPLQFCPHCQWDLAQPDVVEPEDAEKLAFLQSFLGLKPFTRTVDIMGGRVHIRFRTLATREIDAIYSQVYRERERGDLSSDAEGMERANRLRIYLQLSAIITGDKRKELPNGLSRETNPHADSFWKLPEDADEPLKLIEDYVVGHLLVNESLFRIVHAECGRFNRLVSKLEAMVDNSDFWNETGPQR